MEKYSSIQQLMKKEEGEEKVPLFPPTVIQAVFDAKTGASLESILAQYNNLYVQYQGSVKDTRLIIPMQMRRAGLTITYTNMDSETITERASSAVQKDNDHWALDTNWTRVDELSLSGEIAVSAQGTWIINGEDTGIKAVGPKGDAGLTPWLKTIGNRLHFSYDNTTWEPCSDPIAAYFRWNSNKIQISRDNKTWTDLSGEFADNLRIKGYVATYANLPSSAAQGDIYGVGPTYAEDDTEKLNPIYRFYVRNANTWVDNGPFTSIAAGIVQETGDSENAVMSQKAVSAKLAELGSKQVKIDSIGGTSTSAGVDRVGFVYYNLSSKKVMKCVNYTDVLSSSTFEDISNDDALYIWGNHIYKWSLDLGLYNVEPANVFEEKTNLLFRGFIKEFYIFGTDVDAYSGWKVTTIRRNVNNKWEVYVRDVDESIVFVISVENEDSFLYATKNNIYVYLVVDWSVVDEGIDWSDGFLKKYHLTNKVKDANFSPKISEMLSYERLSNQIDSLDGLLYEDENIEIYELYIAKEIIDKGFNPSSITFYNAFDSGVFVYAGVKFGSLLTARNIYGTLEEAQNVVNGGFFDFPSFKMRFKVKSKESTFSIPIAMLNIVSSDLTKCKELYRYIESEYEDILEDYIDANDIEEGKYITVDGYKVDSSSFSISQPISCSRGDIIKVNTDASTSVSIISEYDGKSYIPLLIGDANKWDYSYKVKKDSIIVVSYNTSKGGISIIRKNIEIITPILSFETGKYIGAKGAVQYSSSESYGISNPIKVYEGDKVTLGIKGSSNINAVLCVTNGINKDYQPVIVADTDDYKEYKYLVKDEGYIVVSGNSNNNPSVIIRRRGNVNDNIPCYKLKEYYVNESNYIPENYNSVHVYSGDTKVSENHIVNAVAYPNGEIIACRVGSVVKIYNDGTEKTLLTIAGSTDWRGCYIDKQNNVYVSPHNSFSVGGVSMSMTDRGLYRLKYGEESFEKVISLYNPSSSVVTEQEQNDDTIWTMCEDNKGNIYAGVYAHTVRPNASVYKSSDGGITWNVTSNLIDIADETKGRASHIHCIVYNQYNNALYCIVGEVETVYKSVDGGITWVDLNVWVEDEKGTTLIAVPNGILIGSDGAKEGVISKLYADDKTVKVVGKMWHAEFFGMRRSDLTGWIYAMTKIESTINNGTAYPPYDANLDKSVLQEWKDTTAKGKVRGWTAYHDWVDAYYNHDSIHPTNAAILVSKDNGESWEIIYKYDTKTSSGVGMGIWCVGYFRNGECLCSMSEEINGVKTFTNPVVVREGKLKFNQDGIDLSGDIFIKTNQ